MAGTPESDSRAFCHPNLVHLLACIDKDMRQVIRPHHNHHNLRSHFGSSRGHSWPGLSQWLSSLLHRLRQLLLLVDGHPPRIGVGLLVPTSDDAAASVGIRLRKWRWSLRWGGTISCRGRDDAALAARVVEPIVVRQCRRSWSLSWMTFSMCQRSACRIVMGS